MPEVGPGRVNTPVIIFTVKPDAALLFLKFSSRKPGRILQMITPLSRGDDSSRLSLSLSVEDARFACVWSKPTESESPGYRISSPGDVPESSRLSYFRAITRYYSTVQGKVNRNENHLQFTCSFSYTACNEHKCIKENLDALFHLPNVRIPPSAQRWPESTSACCSSEQRFDGIMSFSSTLSSPRSEQTGSTYKKSIPERLLE